MSVKKGDLVLFTEEAKAYSYGNSVPPDKIMMVVKGPYEGLHTNEKSVSSLSVVVDLLMEGDLMKGIPTRFLKRTNDIKQKLELSSDEIQRG